MKQRKLLMRTIIEMKFNTFFQIFGQKISILSSNLLHHGDTSFYCTASRLALLKRSIKSRRNIGSGHVNYSQNIVPVESLVYIVFKTTGVRTKTKARNLRLRQARYPNG